MLHLSGIILIVSFVILLIITLSLGFYNLFPDKEIINKIIKRNIALLVCLGMLSLILNIIDYNLDKEEYTQLIEKQVCTNLQEKMNMTTKYIDEECIGKSNVDGTYYNITGNYEWGEELKKLKLEKKFNTK